MRREQLANGIARRVEHHLTQRMEIQILTWIALVCKPILRVEVEIAPALMVTEAPRTSPVTLMLPTDLAIETVTSRDHIPVEIHVLNHISGILVSPSRDCPLMGDGDRCIAKAVAASTELVRPVDRKHCQA